MRRNAVKSTGNRRPLGQGNGSSFLELALQAASQEADLQSPALQMLSLSVWKIEVRLSRQLEPSNGGIFPARVDVLQKKASLEI
ncbi:MAG TPA: hypothetical protein VFV38_44570 [Ktedonobacteraceae bacterium]|nr:hypothetical protein [Ktedonobacteraceae bacterium]